MIEINLSIHTILKIKLSKFLLFFIHVLILTAYIIVYYYLKKTTNRFLNRQAHLIVGFSHIHLLLHFEFLTWPTASWFIVLECFFAVIFYQILKYCFHYKQQATTIITDKNFYIELTNFWIWQLLLHLLLF